MAATTVQIVRYDVNVSVRVLMSPYLNTGSSAINKMKLSIKMGRLPKNALIIYYLCQLFLVMDAC